MPTKYKGEYSCSTANFSSRATNNRLRSANSLLWIGMILGADQDKLRQAAAEIGEDSKRMTATACSIVRKYVPFDDLLPCAKAYLQELVEQLNESKQ